MLQILLFVSHGCRVDYRKLLEKFIQIDGLVQQLWLIQSFSMKAFVMCKSCPKNRNSNSSCEAKK